MRQEFPASVKVAALERSEGRCEKCTAKLFPGNISYDHRIPDGSGGEPTLENCQCLCRTCHSRKTAKDVPVIAKGRRVRRKHWGIRKPRAIRAWRAFDGTIRRADD